MGDAPSEVNANMQPMSQAEVDAGEAREFLMRQGWSFEECIALERSVRAQQLGEFNVKLLNGLGSEGLADVRAQLAGGAGAAGPPEAGGRPDHTNTAQEDLVCCFMVIIKYH